jgi:hypothetical protein
VLTHTECYEALVRLARRVALTEHAEPTPGDLVVETTGFHHDPDAIGILLAHGLAPYATVCPACGTHLGDDAVEREHASWGDTFAHCVECDAVIPVRDVWDLRPLNPGARHQTQRWENATFRRLPDKFRELLQGTSS